MDFGVYLSFNQVDKMYLLKTINFMAIWWKAKSELKSKKLVVCEPWRIEITILKSLKKVSKKMEMAARKQDISYAELRFHYLHIYVCIYRIRL